MDPQQTALMILDEIASEKRKVYSPGNLQGVRVSQQEAIDLGLNPPEERDWTPHTTVPELRRIAGL